MNSMVSSKLSLASAISKNSAAAVSAQKTYKQNVVIVNNHVTGVMASKLPSLHSFPPDWQDFVNAYEAANSDALLWVNNVMARLLSVPDEVKSYNSIIVQILVDAKKQAQSLLKDPSDPNALKILKNDLSSVSSQLNLVTAFISGAITNIKQFQSKLPDMATQLQTIADKSVVDAKADQDKINQLKADVKKLNDEIASLTAEIIAMGIADAAAIALGTVATIAAFPIGAVAWLFCGPAIAVATTVIVLDGIEISNDQDKIKSDQKQIDALTADVSTLQLLAQNYGEMAKKTNDIETNLQAVLDEWLVLESDVNAAIADIQTAVSEVDVPNYQNVLNDINDAIKEWNDAFQQSNHLDITLKVNTAQLTVGMSQDEIKNAMNSAPEMDIIAYYNQVG